MSKFSVKKPFYVLVSVIIILVLGAYSLTYMKTDLIPEFNLPYLAVITTDIGASPEQVQEDVTELLEDELASVSGVESVISSSAENYSMIFLQFSEDTDMDSALVKVSAAVNQVASELPSTAGTPTYMEISMDMVASMYMGVSSDTLSLAELSSYVEETVIPTLERQTGVASVSSSGLIEETISVQLNQDKIDNVNDGILGEVNETLASTKSDLDAAAQKLDKAEAKLEKAQAALDEQKTSVSEQLASATLATNTALATKAAYEAQQAVLQIELQIAEQAQDATAAMQISEALTANNEIIKALEETVVNGTSTAIDSIVSSIDEQMDSDAYAAADAAKTQAILTLAEAQNQIDDGLAAIETARAELESGVAAYEEARDTARENANISALLDASTLAQLIYAQNFEMPAGYIEDEEGNSWMLKVGENYASVKELKNTVLTHIDGLGDITLADVADVVVLNNEGETFGTINGQQSVFLSVTKTSTANTGEVCDTLNEAIDKLNAANDDVTIVPTLDQGSYIKLYIKTILQSLLWGALLAVIILALFLRQVRPTLVVAFSIPFSVLFALVIMYFWGLSLNIMTLGALSLAIGMLVDNSVVVLENIYRLKARGMSAARASAQGAKQVTAAVVASTLTTVSVFLPFVFASGIVKQLMVPFALTICFALIASLLVALTVVPAFGSSLFKKLEPRRSPWFEKFQEAYGSALGWALAHKAPVLLLAVALLGGSATLAVNMGIVLIPDMVYNEIMLSVTVPEDMDDDEAREVLTIMTERASEVEGVKDIGIWSSSSSMSLVMGSSATAISSSSSTLSGIYILKASVDDSVHTEAQITALQEEIQGLFDDLGLDISASTAASTISSLYSNSLEIDLYGDDTETLLELVDEVKEAVASVEGYGEVTSENIDEESSTSYHLVFDKNKVARKGTTVAQIYAQIASDLSDSSTAFTMERETGKADVEVTTENLDNLTLETLMDYKFSVTQTDGTTKEYKLSSVATLEEEASLSSIYQVDNSYCIELAAEVLDGYNITLLSRELTPLLAEIDVPNGCSIEIGGTTESIYEMLWQMFKLAALGFLLIYLIMVAQFQSLLAPFIIILTVPLAFTGGLFALSITGEQISVMSLLGFVILMGTIVNNGIVFVDFANQLRLGGMAKRAALVATGKTRMRPILMTAITTICAMLALVFSQEIGAGLERGMAIVVVGGLIYGTFMTLFVVPCVYDILYRKPLRPIDLGDDADDAPDDAQEFIALMGEDSKEACA